MRWNYTTAVGEKREKRLIQGSISTSLLTGSPLNHTPLQILVGENAQQPCQRWACFFSYKFEKNRGSPALSLLLLICSEYSRPAVPLGRGCLLEGVFGTPPRERHREVQPAPPRDLYPFRSAASCRRRLEAEATFSPIARWPWFPAGNTAVVLPFQLDHTFLGCWAAVSFLRWPPFPLSFH